MSTWILLRGLMRETRHWGSFPEKFAAALPDAKVVCFDLPGNGELYAMQSPDRIDLMTEFCRTEMLGRGYQPPYCLLALSLGGMVTSDWMSRYPQEIQRAVLVNTSLRPLAPFYKRLRPQNYGKILSMLINQNIDEREKYVLQMTSQKADSTVLPAWLSYQSEYPVSRKNALRQLLAAWRFRAPRIQRHFPVLLINSLQDKLVHPDCSAQLAQFWQCPIQSHHDAGHDLPLDDPDWLIAAIKASV